MSVVSLPSAEISAEAAAASAPLPRRAVFLDALRGLAILLMIFAGVIPFDQPLPRWMYHAQEPPPTHDFNAHLAGLTFVDLVFPFFLFSLGAAIPLALTARLEKGQSWGKTVIGVLQRGVLLAWFALYFQHIRPYTLEDSPHMKTWLIALLGFALMFPMFTRLPSQWTPVRYWTVRAVGYLGAIALLATLRYPDHTGFGFGRSDIIIIVLANMAVFGTLVWLATRKNILMRLGVLPLFIALRLSSGTDGRWVQSLWDWSPAGWLFQWDFLKYLCIVVPGTIAGDLILAWMRAPSEKTETPPNGQTANWRMALLVAVSLGLIVLVLSGLEARRVLPMTLGAFALGALALGLAAKPGNASEKLVKSFVGWGAYWLALGLLLEPFESGIKKDHATLSYFFVTSGLALFALSVLTILIAVHGRQRWAGLLADAGQNPMLAYVAMGNFIQPLLALTVLDQVLARLMPGTWPGALLGALETLLLAYLVRFFTRRHIFWRT